jgi:hypothetical protein
MSYTKLPTDDLAKEFVDDVTRQIVSGKKNLSDGEKREVDIKIQGLMLTAEIIHHCFLYGMSKNKAQLEEIRKILVQKLIPLGYKTPEGDAYQYVLLDQINGFEFK